MAEDGLLTGPFQRRRRLAAEAEQLKPLLSQFGPDTAQDIGTLLTADSGAAQAVGAGQLQGLLDQRQAGGGMSEEESLGLLEARAKTDLAQQKAGQFRELNPGVLQAQENAQRLQGFQIRQQEQQLADRAKFGPLTPAQHMGQVREIGTLDQGIHNIEDLRTLNREEGRIVLPGAAKGVYDSLRGQVLNTLRIQFEAGALQAAELEFFKSMLPDFGAFNKQTSAQRESNLNELQRQIAINRESLASVTQGQQPLQRDQNGNLVGFGRSLSDILGEAAFPDNTIPVDSTAGDRFGEVGGAVLDSLSFGLPLERIGEFLSQPSPGLIEPKP